jgi:PTH1 family peptidyl-tRNA hydrolase
MAVKLVAGLGNPGARYEATRHNLGFRVVDRVAEELGVSFGSMTRLSSLQAIAHRGDHRIVLLKPLTFMNLSGNAVAPARRFHGVELEDLLVVSDDVALPLCSIRFRARGSSGGHNGLEDIERALGTDEYSRMRIGVDGGAGSQAGGQRDLEKFVLGRFGKEDEETVQGELASMAEAVLLWVDRGIVEAMNRFNSRKDKQ